MHSKLLQQIVLISTLKWLWPRKRALGTHFIGGWMDSKSLSGTGGEENNHNSCQESNTGHTAVIEHALALSPTLKLMWHVSNHCMGQSQQFALRPERNKQVAQTQWWGFDSKQYFGVFSSQPCPYRPQCSPIIISSGHCVLSPRG
jgi:hypothetical protein